MELRVLKYFLATVREGSITAAANSLHLTQPTLTRQLQDLEKELKQQLLIRGKHKVVLTPEGVILKKRAEEIIDMVEKTETEFSSLSKTVSGNVYIGGGETDSMKYIAEIIKQMQEKYPEIKFHIYSGNAEDVMEKLDKGLLDFGILIRPVDVSKYDCLPLPEKDLWGVIMKKDSPLAKKKFIELDDLINIPIIASRQMNPKYSKGNDFLNWFKCEYKNLNIVATYNLLYNATIMVKAGVGYAISLDKLANTSKESDICFKPLKPKLESSLDIVWKKGQIFSPAAKKFLEKIKENFNLKDN